jgi:hypothetical protein
MTVGLLAEASIVGAASAGLATRHQARRPFAVSFQRHACGFKLGGKAPDQLDPWRLAHPGGIRAACALRCCGRQRNDCAATRLPQPRGRKRVFSTMRDVLAGGAPSAPPSPQRASALPLHTD